jgi:hypothetical protein
MRILYKWIYPWAALTFCLISFLNLANSQTKHNQTQIIKALPIIKTIREPRQTPIVLRGQLSKKRQRQAVRLTRAIIKDVSTRFLSDKDKSQMPPVDICLFGSKKKYRQFLGDVFGNPDDHSPMGFYMPGMRLVVANLAHGYGNLRHETVHALLGDDFDYLPDFINEGLGSLYGTARLTKKGFYFLVNYRLRHLRQARAEGRLPDLEALANSGRAEVYGNQSSSAYYGISRYILLYLDRKKKLNSFIKEMRSKQMTPSWQKEVLEKYIDYDAFLKWTQRLKIPGRRKK